MRADVLGGPCRTGLVARQPAANPHRTDSAVGATCGRPRRAGSFDCRFPTNPCFVRSGRRAGCVSARLRDYASGKRRAQATRPTADDYQLCLRGNTAMDSPDSARRDSGHRALQGAARIRQGMARIRDESARDAERVLLLRRRGIFLFSCPDNLAAVLFKQRLFVIVPRGGDFLF